VRGAARPFGCCAVALVGCWRHAGVDDDGGDGERTADGVGRRQVAESPLAAAAAAAALGRAL